MNQGLIPRRYAKALYEYAQDHGTDSQARGQMQALADAFAAEPALQRAMANPFVPRKDKERLLLTAAGDNGQGPAARLATLLGDNNRLDMAREIALAYLKIYREEHNIRLVTVTSAAPLDARGLQRLEQLIQKHLGDAAMQLETHVDPSLIGGFTVSIDNEKLDASVAGELKQLRMSLLKK